MYRVRLGKHTVGDNLVVNGDFSTGDLTGWEEGYSFFLVNNPDPEDVNYSIQWVEFLGQDAVGNIAGVSQPYYLLLQRAIFERGKEYRISFEVLNTTGDGQLALKIGDWGKETYIEGQYSIDRLVLDRGDLVFNPIGSVTWTNISAFELKWNDPLEDEPLNLLEASTSISQAEDIEGLFIEFIEDLEFVGDGYEYLTQQRDEIGFDGVIPILIEESENGDLWEKRFEGTINIPDIIFDESMRVARARVNDSSAQALIVNNSDTKIQLSPQYLNEEENDMFLGGSPYNLISDFDPASIAPLGFNAYSTYRIEEMFAFIVNNITNSRALVLSDSFGDVEIYGNHILSIIYDPGSAPGEEEFPDLIFSFRELFDIVNTVYNVTIQFYSTENVPIIVISRKEDVENEEVLFSLNDVRITERTFKDDIPKNAESGYQTNDEEVLPNYYISDKLNTHGSTKILVPPGIRVEEAYGYPSADVQSGDILLTEAEFQGNAFNNYRWDDPRELINYSRPYYQVFDNLPIINENIKSFSFPISNWMVSLPFSMKGGNKNTFESFEKTNDAYLEEIQFEVPISKEDWYNLLFDTAGSQFVSDPCFQHTNTWQISGDWTISGNGLATLNSFSNGAQIYTLFRDNLVPGTKYRVRIRMQGWSEQEDCTFQVFFVDDTGSNQQFIDEIIAGTATFPGPVTVNTYKHIYDFFITLPDPGLTNLKGIGISCFDTGGSPSANVTFLQVDVFESKILKNVNKLIEVNGSPCKILEIERNNKTGLAQVTALKRYENAN